MNCYPWQLVWTQYGVSAQHCSDILSYPLRIYTVCTSPPKKAAGICLLLSLEEQVPGEALQIQHFAASSAKAKTNLASVFHLPCHMLYPSESCLSCKGGWIGRYRKKFIKITLIGSLCWLPSAFSFLYLLPRTILKQRHPLLEHNKYSQKRCLKGCAPWMSL